MFDLSAIGRRSYHVRTWQDRGRWSFAVDEKVIGPTARTIRPLTVATHYGAGQYTNRRGALTAGRELIQLFYLGVPAADLADRISRTSRPSKIRGYENEQRQKRDPVHGDLG